MTEFFKGTVVPSPIVPSSSGETYASHHSVLGSGGYREVNTIAERDAITVDDIFPTINFDGISTGRRRLGMLVHVFEDDTIYQLHPKVSGNYVSYATWTGYTDTEKYLALSANTSWYPLFDDTDDDSTLGSNISRSYTQTTHGFVVGDVIGHDGTEFLKVSSDTAETIEPLGIVSISDYDGTTGGTNTTFTLTYAGFINAVDIVDYSGNTLTGGTVYYLASSGFTGKLTAIPPTGLTQVSKPMLVKTGGNNAIVLQYRGFTKEEQGFSLGDFIIYSAETQQFLDKTVTGGTNIGFFTGFTGVQTLSILTSDVDYNGDYVSLYNNYYRDEDGIIRIGSPTYNGTLRRGYVSEFSPKKSWIYNTYTGFSNQVGWILVDGDIEESVGDFLTANANSGTPPFTEIEWWYTGGTALDGYYSNGTIALDVNGDLYTGDTYNIGGPVFSDKQFQELRFRTLISDTPDRLKVTYNDNFVFFSATTEVSGVTSGTSLGSGVPVYDSLQDGVLRFKSLVGDGNTTIIDNLDEIIITTSGSTTGSSPTYNLDSPATVTVGGISAGTELTGKTAFQIFEELLVPTLNPTLVVPSNGFDITAPSNALQEIGASISLSFTATFDRGSISPAYGTSGFRSGLPNTYNYTGTGLPSSISTTSLSDIRNVTGYTVLIGNQSWSSSVDFDAGEQPKDSKGDDYDSPYPAGNSGSVSDTIEGVYPLFATTVDITGLTQQTLVSMLTGDNVEIAMVAETGGNKQAFDVPTGWTSSPTNRPLTGIETYNTISESWEYQGGNAINSLTFWTTSSVTQNVQGNTIGYTRYTYNSTDRSAINIRLVF